MRSLKFFFALIVLFFSGQLSAEFLFSGKEARLRVSDPSAQFIINTQLKGFCGTLQRGNLLASQLQGKSTILFDSGEIEAAKYKSLFSGVFDPLNDDFVRLAGNHSLSIHSGIVGTPIMVSGVGNSIQGSPVFGAQIILKDASSSVMFSLISSLNQTVSLNGGTMLLGLDLDLIQFGAILGAGTIDCSGYALKLNELSTSWTSNILFCNALQLQLRGSVALSATWTFSSTAAVSFLDGEHNVLDISNGGCLSIAPGNELVILNTTIRGLGAGYGSIVFGDAKSKLTLSGCTLELSSNYSFSSGLIVCKNVSSIAIVGANNIQFVGSSLLTLDGVKLVYDALSALNPVGVSVDSTHLVSLNGGCVLARVQDENGPAMLFSHMSNVLLKTESLSQNRTMSFSATGTEPVYLDGGGFAIRLPQVKKGVISIADGQTVIFQNMVLDSFYPQHVSLGVGSRLVFGDNVFVQLAGDSVLTYPLMFGGNAVFSGGGNVLTLSKTGSIFASSGKKLSLVDLSIKGISSSSGQITFQDQSSVISCVDVLLQLDSNYAFTFGNMNFNGASSTIVTGSNILSFQGSSCLTVDGVSLFYDTLASADLHNIQPWVSDNSSFISLNGGRICPISSLQKEGDLLLDLRSNVLIQAESLSSSRRIVFRGQRAFGSFLELDGAGFVLQMPRGRSDVIVVPDGKTITMKNIVLRDFSPEHICLGTNSSIIFGDGVLLQLSDDCVLTNAWTFSGKAMIDGRYKRLDFGASIRAGINVASGGCLRIVNTNITGLSGSRLCAASADAKIALFSSTLQLDDSVVFANGCLDIYNDVAFIGDGKMFSFVSPGTLTIHRGAQLLIDAGVILRYDARGGSSRSFIFEDATARMLLQNSTLQSGVSGLSLSCGTVMISGFSKFEAASPGLTSAMYLGVDLDVKIQLGATLDLAGTVVYG